MSNKTKPRIYVQLRAVWGNDDAESTIKISRRRWEALRAGKEEEFDASSWYEGRRYDVTWRFKSGRVWIDGGGGRECAVDWSVDDLYVSIITSGGAHV